MAATVNHETWMAEALTEARRGTGFVSPNPRVGCVIVCNNSIVATGYHHVFGDIHAEVDALRNFTGDASTATMYVTLEPCAHDGKQPACTKAIITSGIKRVVVGIVDPNPIVSGRGIEMLRTNGIEVIVGVLEDECTWMNRWFIHHVLTGSSYVTLKVATSIDLGASAPMGSDRWISSAESRRVTHELRSEYDAVMIGIGTLHADDPFLNVRHVDGRDPIRLIVDPRCETSPTSNVASSATSNRTIIFCHEEHANGGRANTLREKGIEIISVSGSDQNLHPPAIAEAAGSRGISSILLEGGPQLAHSFLNEQCINEMVLHIAPTFLGVEHVWFKKVNPATLTLHSCIAVGQDVHITYTIGRS